MEAESGVVTSYQGGTKRKIKRNLSSEPEELKYNVTKATEDSQDLEEFALKLGYEQSDILAVFEKLGLKVDKNTFLNELISISRQRFRNQGKERSLVQVNNGRFAHGDNNLPYVVARHPNRLIASLGQSTNGGVTYLNSIMVNDRNFTFPRSPIVVASRYIQRTVHTSQRTVPSPPCPTLTRGYGAENQDGVYNTTEGNNFTQLKPDPQEEEWILQELAKHRDRFQKFPPSVRRHVIIDGSNVAMR